MELLTVISIILILISVIVPKIFSYKQKAEDVRIKYNANQIFEACMVSYSENNGSFDTTLISKTVKDITGVDITNPGVTDNTLTVNYECNSQKYKEVIDGGNSTYNVEKIN